MKPSRTSMLIAGIALILLTNAIGLGAAAYNRSGDPDSQVTLTERELALPHDWGRNHENSGLSFTLRWRILMDDAAPKMGRTASYVESGGLPPWLDDAKLLALGFDALPQVDGIKQNDKSLPRNVLLVLESNGPAYQRALQRTREHAASEEALKAANPNNDEIARRAKSANEQLNLEANTASRLFVVDAGLDATQLRSSYPDRMRYAIVHGEVRPRWIMTDNARQMRVGYVSGVHADRIHVPLAFESLFKQGNERRSDGSHVPMRQSEITVAFGRRLEPWIVSAEKR